MSWIAEYDTQGREFPTCVHVTKTTGTMTHGATYVPIEDGKAVRAENAKLVDVLHEVEREAIYAYHCLQQDCVTIANSSEHFFKKWWHAECELDRAKAENTKLRESVTKLEELLKEHGIEVD